MKPRQHGHLDLELVGAADEHRGDVGPGDVVEVRQPVLGDERNRQPEGFEPRASDLELAKRVVVVTDRAVIRHADHVGHDHELGPSVGVGQPGGWPDEGLGVATGAAINRADRRGSWRSCSSDAGRRD
jgi:hypothetical protein